MVYEKAKVTIDLDEYNDLLKISKESKEVIENITEDELSDVIITLLCQATNTNELRFHKQQADIIKQNFGIDITISDKFGASYSAYQKRISFRKSKK